MAFTNKIKKAIDALPVLAKRKSLNDNNCGGTVPKRRRIISCINNIASKFLPQPLGLGLNNILHLTLARLGIRSIISLLTQNTDLSNNRLFGIQFGPTRTERMVERALRQNLLVMLRQ